MKLDKNKVAAITGAGSGIGRALSLNLAARGVRLALSDIDPEGLATTVKRVEAQGGQVTSECVNVADRNALEQWAQRVVSHYGHVHFLVNNAGVSLAASVSQMNPADMKWLMDINFWGVVHGTQVFLPHLIGSGDAHIVNVSSVFGLVGMPTQSAYTAAKFAVKGFSDALQMEMRMEGNAVGVSSVHPGGIRTNIVRSGRHTSTGKLGRTAERATTRFDDQFARNTPEFCASRIVAGVERSALRIVVGGDARVVDWLVRLLPQAYQALLVRMLGGSARVPASAGE